MTVGFKENPSGMITGAALAEVAVSERSRIRSQIGQEWGKLQEKLYKDWRSLAHRDSKLPATFEGIICVPKGAKIELLPVFSGRGYAKARKNGDWLNVDLKTGRGVGVKEDYSVLDDKEANLLFSTLGRLMALDSMRLAPGLVREALVDQGMQGLSYAVLGQVEEEVQGAVGEVKFGFLPADLLKNYFFSERASGAVLQERLFQLRTLASALGV